MIKGGHLGSELTTETKKDGVMPDTDTTVSNIAPSLMVARSPGGSQQW